MIPEQQYPTYRDLEPQLPPRDHPEFHLRSSWLTHILINNLAVFPDFFSLCTNRCHLIDIREESDLKVGYIPGSNWYPALSPSARDDDFLLAQISTDFPKDSLIAIVCPNGVQSRRIMLKLRTFHNFPFAAVCAGGIRLFKVFGFSCAHNLPPLLSSRATPISLHKMDRLSLDDAVLTRAAKEVFEIKKKQSALSQSPSHDHSTDADLAQDFAIQQSIIAEQVARHSGDDTIQWIKIAGLLNVLRTSCIDGRGSEGVVGTPGGDFGIFILLTSVFETLSNVQLTEQQLTQLFYQRLEMLGRFYVHTDELHAGLAIKKIRETLPEAIVTQIDEFLVENDDILPQHSFKAFLSQIPPDYRVCIIDLLVNTSDFIGCGHLKLIFNHPQEYRVRTGLLQSIFRIFYHAAFWAGRDECDFVVLSGTHAECGVLVVQLAKSINTYTKVPLISPSLGGLGDKQMFVTHPSIMQFIREQQVKWFLQALENIDQQTQTQNASITPQPSLALSAPALAAFQPLVELHADIHANSSTGRLAGGLPVYSLTFDVEHSRCAVQLATFVPSPSLSASPPMKPTQQPSEKLSPKLLHPSSSHIPHLHDTKSNYVHTSPSVPHPHAVTTAAAPHSPLFTPAHSHHPPRPSSPHLSSLHSHHLHELTDLLHTFNLVHETYTGIQTPKPTTTAFNSRHIITKTGSTSSSAGQTQVIHGATPLERVPSLLSHLSTSRGDEKTVPVPGKISFELFSPNPDHP